MKDSDVESVGPRPGHLIRDYQLKDTSGRTVMLSDYSGKANLVLITSDRSVNPDTLLNELDNEAARLREYETQVLVVTSQMEGHDFRNVRILLDERGEALRDLGSSAVYITDRFREVIHRFDKLPTLGEILGWVEFTAMQCPECHPPEWPPIE